MIDDFLDLDTYDVVHDAFNELFPVKITGETLISGRWYYAWTEQSFDPDTGAYVDAVSARSGDPTSGDTTNGLVEINDNQVDPSLFPLFKWARLRGVVAGVPLFEFDHCCNSEASSSSSSGCSGTVVTLVAADGFAFVDCGLQYQKVQICLPPGSTVTYL